MTLIVPVLRTWMRAVSEISRAVNVGTPLDAILTQIADLACKLIGFDSCAVMLIDDASERLEIIGWSGLTEEYVDLFRHDSYLHIHPASPEADSPAARAFRDAVSIVISDAERESASYGRLHLAALQGYRSLIASPLHGADTLIGVLVGYSAAPRIYGTADIELSELLAEQTATAIHIATLRGRREWADQQHRRLMQLALDEVGLDGLVETLSEALSTSVAVIDTGGQLLAAAGDTDGSTWAEVSRHPVNTAREPSFATQRVAQAGGNTWVTPVLISGEVTARIWVLDGDNALSDTTKLRLVEQFALVVGIEIITARHALEVEERLSGDLLSDVLRSDNLSQPRVLLERGRALGFDLENAQNVLLVAADSITDQLSAITRRIRNAVGTTVLATSYDDDVVFLVPVVQDLRNKLERVRQQIEARASSPVTIVLSPPIGRIDDIRPAYQAAYGAARLRATADVGGLVDLRDLSVVGLLLMPETPTVYLQRLAEQLITPVADQDQQRDAQLLTTLRAWFESGFSTSGTAKILTVHVNTVGQRLARIEKLTARDLKLPNTRLDLQLALHVWDVLYVTKR
ncbi:helix-turn-helix domain-containing protein [Rhodococcus erythropolis]